MEEHKPVLLKEVLYFLDVKPGRRFIDATIGGSGHAEAILKSGGEVLGIDVSPVALRLAEERIKGVCLPAGALAKAGPSPKVRLVQGNFRDILQIAQNAGFRKVDGILFDLGVASFQIGEPDLGLSFSRDGPLDMRLSTGLGVKACDLINSLPEDKLYELFYEIGQEKRALEIARAICVARSVAPFKTTTDLRQVIEDVYGGRQKVKGPGTIRYGAGKRQKIHPATKVFMALRIAVNLEFENLEAALPQAIELLKSGGRLLVISFHSGEDKRVKQFFKEEEKKEIIRILTKKPITPSLAEIEENPRSRSAKFRVGEKI
ncbi:MAG: 16S rRNA (cytosine(1402)-N(4))-methyltransferase RsmH [Candidatus Blackburnbacteria bacterium]|nr:16S rRNA (cytosine(1402)-N(4))-methyltransferase RsmH [Candidatus Blackburnbacteria bacterium]